MPAAASYARKSFLALLGSAVALAGLQVLSPPAAQANTAGTGLVINEIYGGGGNSGATYKNDFFELYNPTDSAISVDGWSIQYGSATATTITSANTTALSGSVPAHGYFLVQEAAGTGGTADLPTPNVTGTIAVGAAGGKVFLVSSTTLLSGTQLAAGAVTPGSGVFTSVVDMVGSNAANQFEGAVSANPANATSLSRNANHDDTDNNSADFTVGNPSPTNAANNASALAITTPGAQTTTTGAAFSLQVAATGGSGTKTYAIASGSLPNGLALNPTTGLISGNATETGTFTLAVSVTDDTATKTTASFTVTVNAPAAATHVVISQLFGDGNFKATLPNSDYVVLYNPTATPVDLTGTSLAAYAYNRATNTGPAWQSALTGTIAAHGHYLIGGPVGSIGTNLPKPDFAVTGDINYFDGFVALLNTTSALTLPIGNVAGNASIIDGLGYGGTAANTFEGAPEQGGATTTTALGENEAYRNPENVDNDNNKTDFGRRAPAPVNSVGETQPELTLTQPVDQYAIVDKAITPLTLVASGGVGALTYELSGAPAGVTIDHATGAISGTATVTGDYTVTASVTDSATPTAHTTTTTFSLHVGTFAVTNPGDQVFDTVTPVDLAIKAVDGAGNSNHFTFALKAGSTLPAPLVLGATSGHITGKPAAVQAATPVTITVTNTADDTTLDVTFDVTVTADVFSIAQLQGTGARSPYADPTYNFVQGSQTVTTKGVITGIYATSYSSAGAKTCGLCGFYLQDPYGDPTDGASDAIFVYGGSSFTGAGLAVGQSVKVSGKVSEFDGRTGTPDTSKESLTELNLSGSVTTVTPALDPITYGTTLPATYQDREAHEGEAYAPTDVVVTDTYQYETDGELGLATGDKPLVEPTETCRYTPGTTSATDPCLVAADKDIVDRGYFLGAGTSTQYTSSSTHYAPQNSKNSDIPLPFMDKTHSARVGAHVQVPTGHALILDFRHDVSASSSTTGPGKWYLQPERSVSATGCSAAAPHTGCTVDLGSDVVGFENTRADNAAPADVTHGDADAIKVATYNVENFFTETGEEFAAENPHYTCSYDDDRAGNPILTYQCTAADAQASAWDPVSGAATAYKSGIVNGPRGAARDEDQQRQTQKIVTAINGLDADVVSLEELENPNKLKRGVKTGPLNPLPAGQDTSELKDQGLGTNIAWRDETISYLVDKLNAALVAQGGTAKWAFVASPEEATDATSVTHLCSITNADGSPIAGNDASRANASCSYASGQDVIRSGFIYDRTKIVPVGQSDIDFPGYSVNGTPDPYGNYVFPDGGTSPFDNAREPLAQYFKRIGDPNSNGFAVIVNHFKSKGNDTDTPGVGETGENYNDPRVGSNNGNRTKQALELLRFANAFAAKWKTDKVFMVGDFNSYTAEDPVQAILNSADNKLGFTLQESDDTGDLTYDYSTTEITPNATGVTATNTVSYGAVGSIDHVFVSSALDALITGTDVWEINANETDAYDYGRYNTNATDFFDASQPFRGSDHNPEIIGFALPTVAAGDKVGDVQILGVNDFHGRLIGDSSDGGAAQLAGAVKSLRSIYGADSTVFASAGDNVGASIFESFTQQDKPTLDALTAMGLQVSSVGNHEFDKGWKDLIDRIEKPYDATDNPYGADGGLSWGDYLAANVVYTTDPDGAGPLKVGDPIGPATKTIEVTNPATGHQVKIGFIGTVTSDLTSLESPANLEGVQVLSTEDTVTKVNQLSTQLKAGGAKLVVLLTHEGAATTDCSTMGSAGTAFSTIVNGVGSDVDAVLSGHTHLEYSCSFPVDAWKDDAITSRPVMQAGSYGMALDQLVYSFDTADDPVAVVSNNVGVKGAAGTNFNYPQDAAVKAIVDRAKADSEAAGATVLGRMSGPLYRSKLSDGTDNRGGESTLGNQVAEIQRWATADAQHGSAQIAFMNPGGLRADAVGVQNGDAYDLTYREAADVQPFANELTNMQLTGAQIKKVLEEQWQRDTAGNIPARPFLKLGISKGFTYTYTEVADPAHAGATLGQVTGMWLDGTPISLTTSYSVTVNSFLSTGGDNFWELDNGASKKDTELTDLQAQVEYMEQYKTTPLQVDYSQRGVSVTFPSDAPSTYEPGDQVVFDLKSLDMTAPGDQQDDNVVVKLGGATLDTFAITHGNSLQPYDDRGTAHVAVTLPQDIAGAQTLTVVGDRTGTRTLVQVQLPKVDSTLSAEDVSATYGSPADLVATVANADGVTPTGTVTFKQADGTVIGTATVDGQGVATYTVPSVTLASGTITAAYGDDSSLNDSTTTFALSVAKASAQVMVDDTSVRAGQNVTVHVMVKPGSGSATPTGDVTFTEGDSVLGHGTLEGGLADVALATSGLSAGDHTLTVSYAGSAGFDAASTVITLTVTEKPTATVSAPTVGVVYGRAVTVPVTVSPSTAGGSVVVRAGGIALGTFPVRDGRASVVVPARRLAPGAYTLTLAYSGDDTVAAKSATSRLTVARASSAIAGVKVTPKKVKAKKTRATVSFRVVGANGVVPTGRVTISGKGMKAVVGTIRGGRASVRLPKLGKGTRTLTIRYAGDRFVTGSSAAVKVKVTK